MINSKECSFKPKLNSKSITMSSFDEKKEAKPVEHQSDMGKEQHNFKPKINANSIRMLSENKPKQNLTPYERLYQEAEARQKK